MPLCYVACAIFIEESRKELYFMLYIPGAKFAFSIYDMDGIETVDACRLGDLLRALELTPTLKTISKLGGTTRRGKSYNK